MNILKMLASDFVKTFVFFMALAVLLAFLITLMMYPWQTIIAGLIGAFVVALAIDLA
jgi:hypothetical protein